MNIELNMGTVITRYQQLLADAQLRAIAAEVLVEQYKAALAAVDAPDEQE